MGIEELKAKYALDAVNLRQYRQKKEAESEMNKKKGQAFNTHEWKAKFVVSMKKLSPNFNGSVDEVERLVMSARLNNLNPEAAAKKAFEYYSKFKPGTNGYAEWKKLNGGYSSLTRTKAPNERVKSIKESEMRWKKL